MDDATLQQFSRQLARWLQEAMERSHLPFRKLSLDLPVVTSAGQRSADIVLWINRPSLITGSIILLPSGSSNEILPTGNDLARALGIAHFVTWEARRVVIWTCLESGVDEHLSLSLPAARQTSPADFQQVLNRLLQELKVLAVTTALPAGSLPEEYFLNLCLMVRRDILPLVTAEVQRTAGAERSDCWVEETPLATTWMTLWRVLLMLHCDRLPPGMQPERLEKRLVYALSDLAEELRARLQKGVDEPGIGGPAAVRLYHFANRLKQLGWPQEKSQTRSLVRGLLPVLARELGLASSPFHPPSVTPTLLINVHPPIDALPAVLSAPPPYLAGVSLLHSLDDPDIRAELIDEIPALPRMDGSPTIMAQAFADRPPTRIERQRRQLKLRQVWPNRRFELPAGTPTYFWDAIHILGIQEFSGDLDLILPAAWPFSPGAESFWNLVAERYELRELEELPNQRQRLRLTAAAGDLVTLRIQDTDEEHRVSADLLYGEPPGFLNLSLHAPPEIRDLLAEGRLRPTGGTWSDGAEGLDHGVARFAETSLGQSLWTLCAGRPLPAERGRLAEQMIAVGMPLPERSVLVALKQVDDRSLEPSQLTERLDRELRRMLGARSEIAVAPDTRPASRGTPRTSGVAEGIRREVFRDGAPMFPEHYLMDFYRPALHDFEVPGPLTAAEAFFGTILLTGPAGFRLEVDSAAKAECLCLASQAGPGTVSLPRDDEIGQIILERYREDLKRLWGELQAACRSEIPRRQSAASLARRIWRDQKLPSPELFEA